MEPVAPQPLDTVRLEDGPFKYGDDSISPEYAKQLVCDTFTRLEIDRNRNYEGKWAESVSLYEGTIKQRTWDNNKGLRSAIPNNIAFDHVEGALAMIEAAIFDTGEDWFSVDAMPGADPRDAKDIRAVYERDLDTPDPDYGFTTGRSEIRLSLKSMLLKGEGMLFTEWDARQKRPRDRYIDINDVYVDQDLRGPNIEDARCIIIRDMMTADELQQYKGIPGIKVPPDPNLAYYMQTRPIATADSTTTLLDNLQGLNTSPVFDNLLPQPTANKVEILRYYDKARIIWIINRYEPMLIMRNPYGFYPISAAPCRVSVGRFYGTSYPLAVRNQQRASEAMINAMVDEAALLVNPPQIIPQGAKASEYTVYPGRTVPLTGDAKQVITQAPSGQTMNLMPLAMTLVQQAEQRNGLNAASIGGNARPGNINRTRAGVDMQSRGTDARTAHVIKNVEDYQLIPLFYKHFAMYRVHVQPDEVIMDRYPSRDDRFSSEPITGAIFHKPVRFSMEAASRLLTRNQVGQTLPFVMQTLMSGQLMGALASQNKTIDIEGVTDMIEFATGAPKKFNLFRRMTEEEIKAKDQPPQQAVMQMQAKQQSDQMKVQLAREGNQTKLQVAQIAKQPDPYEAQIKQQAAQFKQQESQQKIDAEYQSLQMKLQAQAQEMQLKAQMKEREMEIKQREMLQKFQEVQMGTAAKAQGHQMDMAMQQERAQFERARMAMGIQQQARMNEHEASESATESS